MSFAETIEGLINEMRAAGIDEELILFLSSGEAGDSLNAQANYLPQEFAETLAATLTVSCDGRYCYLYCHYIEDRSEVWQALIDSGDGMFCFLYCLDVKDRPEVRQALIDSGNVWYCYHYCLNVKDRPEVQQVLIDSGNTEVCYWYCQNVKDRPEVRKVFDKE